MKKKYHFQDVALVSKDVEVKTDSLHYSFYDLRPSASFIEQYQSSPIYPPIVQINQIIREDEELFLRNKLRHIFLEDHTSNTVSPLSPIDSLLLMFSSLSDIDTVTETDFKRIYKLEESHFQDNIKLIKEMDQVLLLQVIMSHVYKFSATLLQFVSVFGHHIPMKTLFHVVTSLYYLPTIQIRGSKFTYTEEYRQYRQDFMEALVRSKVETPFYYVDAMELDDRMFLFSSYFTARLHYGARDMGVIYNLQSQCKMSAREFELSIHIPLDSTKSNQNIYPRTVDLAVKMGDIELIRNILSYKPELLLTGYAIYTCILFDQLEIFRTIIGECPDMAINPRIHVEQLSAEEACVALRRAEMLKLLYENGYQVDKLRLKPHTRELNVIELDCCLTSAAIYNRDIVTMEVLFQRPTPDLFHICNHIFLDLLCDESVEAYHMLVHLSTVRRMYVPPLVYSSLITSEDKRLPIVSFPPSPIMVGFLINLHPTHTARRFNAKEWYIAYATMAHRDESNRAMTHALLQNFFEQGSDINVVGLNLALKRFSVAGYILLKYPVDTFLDPYVCHQLDTPLFNSSEEYTPWVLAAREKTKALLSSLMKGLGTGGGTSGSSSSKKKKKKNKQKEKEKEKEKENGKEKANTKKKIDVEQQKQQQKPKETDKVIQTPELLTSVKEVINNNKRNNNSNSNSNSNNNNNNNNNNQGEINLKLETCPICTKEFPITEIQLHFDTVHVDKDIKDDKVKKTGDGHNNQINSNKNNNNNKKKKQPTPTKQSTKPINQSPAKPQLQIKTDLPQKSPISSPSTTTTTTITHTSPSSKQINVNKVKIDKKQQQEEILSRYNIVEEELDRTVGKFKFSRKDKYIIGRGSNGTLVFMGLWSEFKVPVAIKQMHKAFNETSRVVEEIDLMIKLSNEQGSSNMVRYIDKEEDDMFFYLGVSLCDCSIQELFENPDAPPLILEQKKQLDKMAAIKDMINGVTFLHQHNVVHNDLNPRNILLKDGRFLISDMGLSKLLTVDSSFSLTHSPTGTGGYHPSEIITGQRKTKSVDIFSLGCLICYVLSDGKGHPFGKDKWLRLARIMGDQANVVEALPDANKESIDLISQMILKDPDSRPSILTVSRHPLFWTTQQKMVFIDTCYQSAKSSLWNSLGITLQETINLTNWDTPIDKNLLQFLTNNVKQPYNFEYVKDLIRCIRNVVQHFQDIFKTTSNNRQQQYFTSSESAFQYFDTLFPQLVINLYIKFRSNPNWIKSIPSLGAWF